MSRIELSEHDKASIVDVMLNELVCIVVIWKALAEREKKDSAGRLESNSSEKFDKHQQPIDGNQFKKLFCVIRLSEFVSF